MEPDAAQPTRSGRLTGRAAHRALTDNAYIESFNGRLRDECLNAHWFLSLADARSKIETWRRHYKESRPYTSLGWLTPQEFALSAALKTAG